MATDIGLVARRFDRNLVVWANSLNSLRSLGGVKVNAIDRWNQVVGSGTTTPDGTVKITLKPDATPKHLVAVLGDDYSFLDLRKHKDKLTGYDTEGLAKHKTTVRSYIYSDRGVYRPGDTAPLWARLFGWV